MIVIIMSVLLNNTLAKCYMKKRVDDTHPNNEILTMLYLNISDSICLNLFLFCCFITIYTVIFKNVNEAFVYLFC